MMNVNSNYELRQLRKEPCINYEELTSFYILRGYIQKESYGYSATALGVEKGCFFNDKKHNAVITNQGINRFISAFNY